VSPELERLLRQGREALPEPGEAATRRARERAVAAVRRRRPRRRRLAAVLGGALLAAAGLGAGLGVVLTPGGTASRGPVALGFLPAPGWFAYQTGTEASPVFQTIAVASSIPLDPEDVVAGAADPSGLPYATLLKLPPDGIVMVASFTRPFGVPRYDTSYPRAELPLRLRDATTHVAAGTQIRPDEPLGQLQLRATVEGRRVDVVVYFGTPSPSDALRAQAQRQLEGLVIRPSSGAETRTSERSAPPTDAGAAPGVVDRTFACGPSLAGGVRKLAVLARKGSGRRGARWDRPALAGVTTNVSSAGATAVENYLVWVSAGRPSALATIPTDFALFEFPVSVWGTVAVNRARCRASRARVELSPRGLSGGGEVGVFPHESGCATSRAVLVRVRAVTHSSAALESYRSFVRTVVPVEKASIAVQAQAGERLVFAQVLESGKALLFTSPSCRPD
jgi:hypothetical protein